MDHTDDQVHIEEDGWQDGNSWKTQKVLARIALFFILAAIAVMILISKRTVYVDDALRASARSSCNLIIHEIINTESKLGYVPDFTELKDSFDLALYDNMHQIGKTPVGKGFRKYYFLLLTSAKSKKEKPVFQAVVAYPIKNGKHTREMYYMSLNTGLMYQANIKKTPLPTTVNDPDKVPPGWTVCK